MLQTANDVAINASKRIMGCRQMPLSWRQTTRHEMRCAEKTHLGRLYPQSRSFGHLTPSATFQLQEPFKYQTIQPCQHMFNFFKIFSTF